MAAHDSLRLEQVRKRVADFTLEADFELAPGERACLVGPSGSGKTSLLRLIAGLESPDSGRVRVGSRDLTALAPEKRGIGMIFQEQALFPSMSSIENAAFGLRVRGVPRAERERQAREWLERLGLGSRADAAVGTLSGGERQRVAFVRALIWKPTVLLLDEPFSALDASLRDVLRQDLLSLHREWPVPLLMVSHDAEDLRAIANVRLEIRGDSRGVRSVARS
ncbi:MAG TPA: ATP-binding cassette domain-containing protein [Bdellovibrionota bacterium]|nr:ATP-binding cassette domain-containing protein [Bdellovibrionota bacterium]